MRDLPHIVLISAAEAICPCSGKDGRRPEGIAMTRKHVLDLCYQARTLKEIETAKQARGEWLAAHPGDATVLDVGEMLCMLEDALRDTDVASQLPTVAVTR